MSTAPTSAADHTIVAEIAIKVFHLGLAIHRWRAIIAIEHRRPPCRLGHSIKHNRSDAPTKPSFRDYEPNKLPCPPEPLPPPCVRGLAFVDA